MSIPRGSRSDVVRYGRDTVNGRPAFAANYINVGYFLARDDKLNSFQVVLVDRGDTGVGKFDIEFNYDRIQWETGDFDDGINGFGGTSAAAGWSNGSGQPGTYSQIAGSQTPGAFLDSSATALVRRTLNSTVNGRLVFQARSGSILTLSLTSLSPSTAPAGSPSLTLTVNGSGFVSGCAVYWNSTSLTTTFVTSTQLRATVPATALTSASTAQVSVRCPSLPASNSLPFTVGPNPSQVLAVLITADPAQPITQPFTLSIRLSAPASVDVTGTLELQFTPDPAVVNPVRDPALQFPGGGTTMSFRIPAGSTTAAIPSNGQMQRGTVAGQVAVVLRSLRFGTADAPVSGVPPATLRVAPAPPAIVSGSVRIVDVTSAGFVVELTGYSTVRSLQNANLRFQPSVGGRLDGSTTFTVALTIPATAWFASAAGRESGSRFAVRIPFTVNGSVDAIGSVAVILSNSVGASSEVAGGR